MRNKNSLKLINYYQKNISKHLPTRCRYTPTCSEYAKQAYSTYGFFKASYLTFKRICRCNLFAPHNHKDELK